MDSVSDPVAQSFKANIEDLKKGLEDANFGETLEVDGFASFHVRLEHMFSQYSRQPLAKLVNDHLVSHLEHLKSFDVAVTLSVHQQGNFLWSAILAIIEVCSTSSVSSFVLQSASNANFM